MNMHETVFALVYAQNHHNPTGADRVALKAADEAVKAYNAQVLVRAEQSIIEEPPTKRGPGRPKKA